MKKKVFLETEEYDIYMFPVPDSVLKGRSFLCTLFPRKKIIQWVLSWMEKLHPCFDGRFMHDIRFFREKGHVMALVTVAEKLKLAPHLVKRNTVLYVQRPDKRRVFDQKSPFRILLRLPACFCLLVPAVFSGFFHNEEGHRLGTVPAFPAEAVLSCSDDSSDLGISRGIFPGSEAEGGEEAWEEVCQLAVEDESPANPEGVEAILVAEALENIAAEALENIAAEPCETDLPEASVSVVPENSETEPCAFVELSSLDAAEILPWGELSSSDSLQELPLVPVTFEDGLEEKPSEELPSDTDCTQEVEAYLPVEDEDTHELCDSPFVDDFVSLLREKGGRINSFRWQTLPSLSAVIAVEGSYPEEIYEAALGLCASFDEALDGMELFDAGAMIKNDLPALSFSDINYSDNIPSFLITLDYSRFQVPSPLSEGKSKKVFLPVQAVFRQMLLRAGGKVVSESMDPPFVSGIIPYECWAGFSEDLSLSLHEDVGGLQLVSFDLSSEETFISVSMSFCPQITAFFPLEHISVLFPVQEEQSMPPVSVIDEAPPVVCDLNLQEVGTVCMENGLYVDFYRNSDGSIIKGDPYEK
ncbi:MAG: hypothetical protein K5930_12225 [Treponemataceae bacterium]|nr:hypothetical protein [Treponemataceae bacterium]